MLAMRLPLLLRMLVIPNRMMLVGLRLVLGLRLWVILGCVTNVCPGGDLLCCAATAGPACRAVSGRQAALLRWRCRYGRR